MNALAGLECIASPEFVDRGAELFSQLVGAGRDDGQPVFSLAVGSRPGDRRQRQIVVSGDTRLELAGSLDQFGIGRRCQHHQFCLRRMQHPGFRWRDAGGCHAGVAGYVFFQDGVRIHAPETKGIHARAARMRGAVDPGTRDVVDVERCFFEVQRRIDLITKRRRQHLVMQRQRGLDHRGGTGGRNAVADHRLHRADARSRQIGIGGTRAEHRTQGLNLRLVAQGDAGAVGFDQTHCSGVDVAGFVGALERQNFAFHPGRQQPLGLAVG